MNKQSPKSPDNSFATATRKSQKPVVEPCNPTVVRLAAGQTVSQMLPLFSLAQAKTIAEKRNDWSKDQFMNFIENLVPQDRWIAGRIYHNGLEVTKESFRQLREDSKHVVDLKRFIQLHPQLTYDYKMTDINLRATFGIRPLQEFINFIDLFERVGTKGRSYLSPIQPDVRGLFKIAQTPLVNLPKSTIKAIVRYDLDRLHGLLEIRPGDLPSLIPAVKAWSVCPDLPLSIAEKIGGLPSIDRMAAAISWNRIANVASDDATNRGTQKADRTEKFWSTYAVVKRLGKSGILERYSDLVIDHSGCQRIVQEFFPAWSRDEQRSLSKELAATFIDVEIRRANIAEVLRDLNVGVWKKARRSLPADTALKASLVFRDVATYDSVCTRFGVIELFRPSSNASTEELQPIDASPRERAHCHFTAIRSVPTQMHAFPSS